MKIALVAYDFEDYCIRLAGGLANLADVSLFLVSGLREERLSGLDSRVTLDRFDKPRLRQPVRQLRTGWELVRRVTACDPDVVHLQHGHLWFNALLPLLRRFPMVVTVHDPRHHVGDRGSHKTPQPVLDFGFRRADQLIAHAEPLKRVIVDECRIDPDRVHVVPHVSLDDVGTTETSKITTKSTRMTETAGAGPDDDRPTVLFFGRIWEYKGLEYLIRAEPLISAQVPGVKIVIAGEGEDFGRYRRLMVHPERFDVHNEFVADDRRSALFRQASIIVLPYVDASQSGVIPIAYAFEKPVVATTVGGLPEMVEHGRTGYLVRPRDERALADAIVHLLRDHTLRAAMGRNGSRKLDAECAPSVIARQTMAVYHRAVLTARHPRVMAARSQQIGDAGLRQ